MAFMTPLRWKIAAGYLVFAIITVVLWKDLIGGWSILTAFLTPVFTFFAALIALKFTVVLAALSSFVVIFLKGAVSMLISVSKIGIIKGLFLPWLMTALQWLHKKSSFLQKWVGRIYKRAKHLGENTYAWWKSKNIIDRFLLLGFLGPLIFLVSFVFLIKRFVYVFISKKAAEQVVQKATAATVKNLHRIPAIETVKTQLKTTAKNITDETNRKLKRIKNDANRNRSPKSE